MPRGIPLQRAFEWAQAFDRSLQATDFGNTTTLVDHDEGLYLRQNSFHKIHDGEWIVVFSEHADPAIFHFEDVNYFATFEPTYGSELKPKKEG